GMTDWLPISSVPELMSLMQRPPASAPRPAAGAVPETRTPLGGIAVGASVAMHEQPKAAAAAARRPRAAAVDLFGTHNELPASLPSPPPPPRPVAQVASPNAGPASAQPMMFAPSAPLPAKRGMMGIVVAMGAALVVVCGAVAFFMLRQPAPAPIATNDQNANAATAMPAPPPADTQAPAPPPADTAQATPPSSD